MIIEVPGSNKTHNIHLPTRLLLNNATVFFITRHSGGALRFRDARQFKKSVYRFKNEMPDWYLVEVTGKDGEEKVKIRL